MGSSGQGIGWEYNTVVGVTALVTLVITTRAVCTLQKDLLQIMWSTMPVLAAPNQL